MVYKIDLLNTVLGDMEDVYHKSSSGVATVQEEHKLKSFSCNNNWEQTVAKGSSNHPVCGIICIDKIWLQLELSSCASLKYG